MSPMSPFLTACEEGNFEKVKAILQTDTFSRNTLLRLTDARGWNVLHFAANHHDAEWMRYLLTFKEVDVNARCNERSTAFYGILYPEFKRIAVENGEQFYSSEPVMEMIKMLFEVNRDIINCGFEGMGSPLKYGLQHHHFDVVKLLIKLERSFMNNDQHNFSVLHTAVSTVFLRVDCIRYLLYEENCDPSIADGSGELACCVFVKHLLTHLEPSKEQIEFAAEFLSITYKSPAETIEVCFLLIDCFTYKDCELRGVNDGRAYKIFKEIVKLLLPNHPRKNFVEKILQAKLPSDYCLITLILFENFDKISINCKLVQAKLELYLRRFGNLTTHFLKELFTLFLADESFFNEYITEIVRVQWQFNKLHETIQFCKYMPTETSSQNIFDFTKILLRHGFSRLSMLQLATSLLISHRCVHFFNVFLPLSNLVHDPFGSEKRVCRHKLVEGESDRFEVGSLKDLARISVRKYIFRRYAHYEALSLLYSLNIPIKLRQFLCYNYLNLKF